MAKEIGRSLEVDGLTKRYGTVRALDDVSLRVEPGEFMALLGPSGSGKSTLLMAIAGFQQPDEGDVRVAGKSVLDRPPHQRDIGIVFQRYALFPHMSVDENLAYPLRRRSVGAAEIRRRVDEALALVQLGGYAGRYPEHLSGGQQQRVALARALIARPPVLLMDEPLSALDKQLRQSMQIELKLLHRQIGTTIVLVTHDQEEALAMADRVALLHDGRLKQVGTPQELYRTPVDAFAASFIGVMNFLAVAPGDGGLRIAGFEAALPELSPLQPDPKTSDRFLGIRPEEVLLSEAGPGNPCEVVEVAYQGPHQHVLVDAGGQRLTALVSTAGRRLWDVGDRAHLRFGFPAFRFFPSRPSAQHWTGA